MCLRHKSSQTDKEFDILLPEVQQKRNVGTRKAPSRLRSADSGEIHYKWPGKKKILVVMAIGLPIYQSLREKRGGGAQEMGKDNNSKVSTLLKQLLDCIAGVSYLDVDDLEYIHRLMPLN